MIRRILGGARTVLGLGLVGLLFLVSSPLLRLFVIPVSWLRPGLRDWNISWFMKYMSGGILLFLRLAGIRARRHGTIPTERPVLIVANHQSLIDILQITLMSRPFVPAFVTRKRYARFVPLVSASLRLLRAPIVEPKAGKAKSILAVARAARSLQHGLIIFAEGHRSKDGSIGPFRTNGIEIVLRLRRTPVYLVLGDGFWRLRRFADLLLHYEPVEGWSEVLGPFEPPEADEEIPAFIEGLRDRMIRRLEEVRASRAPAA
jgi:1-acyl-sn-glycerol-3-phosphate acyltransferase